MTLAEVIEKYTGVPAATTNWLTVAIPRCAVSASG